MRIIKADILSHTCDLLVHGVNLKGKFNAGLAKIIRKKYPPVYVSYMSTYKNAELGDYVPIILGEKVVCNLFSQKTYGRTGIHADLKAIENGLRRIINDLEPALIAIPKIGCGLGGLDWSDVRVILEELEKEYSIIFEVYYL